MIFRDEETQRAWDAVHAGRQVRAIPDGVRELLGDVAGRHVLQLFPGHARSTAELVELGALVTAVDDREAAILHARERAPDAAAVAGDPNDVPIELRRGRFDVVYCDEIERVRDLSSAVSTLTAGGVAVLTGDHPAAVCVDPIDLRWREDYFEQQTIGAVVALALEAGLRVDALHELPSARRRLDRRVPGLFAIVASKA